MKQTFMYCRKSQESEERQALSIPSQIQELTKIAQRENIKISKTFEESQSAKKPGRKIFNKVLEELEKENIKSILVWNPDRLSRNSVDTGKIIYLMDQGIIDEIITPTQTFKATPNDKFLFNILCGQAKLENDNRGINAKRGMKTKAEMGWYPAPAPIGYLNTPNLKKGFKVLKKDPLLFPIVQRCFKSIVKGLSPIETYNKATKEWGLRNPKTGNPPAISSFYNMLNNPLYYGEYEWPKKSGNWYEGKHKAMITQEEFDVIQKILGNKGKPSPRTHTHHFKLTGLMRCSYCGCAITASRKIKHYPKTGNVGKYVYYHCSKKNKSVKCPFQPIKPKDLNKQILDILFRVKPDIKYIHWAKKWISIIHQQESQQNEDILASQHQLLETTEKKLNNLLDLRINDGLDDMTYKNKKRELEKEKKRIQSRLEQNSDDQDNWRTKVEDALDFAFACQQKFKLGNKEEKHFVLTKLGSNLKLSPDKKFSISLEDEYKVLENQDNWEEEYKDWVEPQKYTDLFEKRPHLRPSIPFWLPG